MLTRPLSDDADAHKGVVMTDLIAVLVRGPRGSAGGVLKHHPEHPKHRSKQPKHT